MVGRHVHLVMDIVASNGKYPLGAHGLGIDLDGGAVEGETIVFVGGQVVLLDAAADLNTMEQNLIAV